MRNSEIGKEKRVIEVVPEKDPVPKEVPLFVPDEWVPEREPENRGS